MKCEILLKCCPKCEKCLRVLKMQNNAPNSKKCSKGAQHNRERPNSHLPAMYPAFVVEHVFLVLIKFEVPTGTISMHPFPSRTGPFFHANKQGAVQEQFFSNHTLHCQDYELIVIGRSRCRYLVQESSNKQTSSMSRTVSHCSLQS